MYHTSFHFQFALDRSHRLQMAATEYRMIARADAAAAGHAAPEGRVPATTYDGPQSQHASGSRGSRSTLASSA